MYAAPYTGKSNITTTNTLDNNIYILEKTDQQQQCSGGRLKVVIIDLLVKNKTNYAQASLYGVTHKSQLLVVKNNVS